MPPPTTGSRKGTEKIALDGDIFVCRYRKVSMGVSWSRRKSPVKVSTSMENQCFRAMTHINPERRQECPSPEAGVWGDSVLLSLLFDPYHNQLPRLGRKATYTGGRRRRRRRQKTKAATEDEGVWFWWCCVSVITEINGFQSCGFRVSWLIWIIRANRHARMGYVWHRFLVVINGRRSCRNSAHYWWWKLTHAHTYTQLHGKIYFDP